MIELPEGWIAHDGGPRPVDALTRVKLLFEGETIEQAESTAFDLAYLYKNKWQQVEPAVLAYKPEQPQ